MASEQQAERAVALLKRMIDAAENSNQAGEDAVVAAAAGPALLASLQAVMAMLSEAGVVLDCLSKPTPLIQLLNTQAEVDALEAARTAIAKATGAS